MISKNKKCEMSNLLNDSLEKYYWLGFLIADGHFSKTNRLVVGLSAKDENHLVKLQHFLKIEKITKTSKKYSKVLIQGMDSEIISTIKNQFKIKSNKTKNPCDISSIKGDNLLAFSIGLIDGDGSICKFSKRKDAFIRVKLYHTWLDNLNYLFPNRTKINPMGYAEAFITGWPHVKSFKQFAIRHSLPILERKWDRIDLNYLNKNERSKKCGS